MSHTRAVSSAPSSLRLLTCLHRGNPLGPKTESRRVTLECQTLKVREPVRRSFVTDPQSFVISLLGNQWVPSIGLR